MATRVVRRKRSSLGHCWPLGFREKSEFKAIVKAHGIPVRNSWHLYRDSVTASNAVKFERILNIFLSGLMLSRPTHETRPGHAQTLEPVPRDPSQSLAGLHISLRLLVCQFGT